MTVKKGNPAASDYGEIYTAAAGLSQSFAASQAEVGRYKTGEYIADIGGTAATGFAVGGPVGAAVGAVVGIAKSIFGRKRAKKEAARLEKARQEAIKRQNEAYNTFRDQVTSAFGEQKIGAKQAKDDLYEELTSGKFERNVLTEAEKYDTIKGTSTTTSAKKELMQEGFRATAAAERDAFYEEVEGEIEKTEELISFTDENIEMLEGKKNKAAYIGAKKATKSYSKLREKLYG